MYLLIFIQNHDEIPVALFENMDNGRRFVASIPGYKMTEEKDGNFRMTYESFSPRDLPDYLEIFYEGKQFPISRFMFKDNDDVEILWREIPNMDNRTKGLVEGETRVDAYVVDNDKLKSYIEKREEIYKNIKTVFESRGYEVERNFYGSEDGEAVVYRKKGESDWYILMHMDPNFVYDIPLEEKAFDKWFEHFLQ